jgi:hypothetical protein
VPGVSDGACLNVLSARQWLNDERCPGEIVINIFVKQILRRYQASGAQCQFLRACVWMWPVCLNVFLSSSEQRLNDTS